MNEGGNDTNKIKNNSLLQNSYLIHSHVIKNCINCPAEIEFLEKNIISKIPIIISKKNINICISKVIKFFNSIDQILSIKNNLIIEKITFFEKVNILNIKGKIKKIITYTQKNTISQCKNSLKSLIIYIPFDINIETNINLDVNYKNNLNEIYCEPVFSKILDKFLIGDDKKNIYNIINLILQINILQNQYININTNNYKIDKSFDNNNFDNKMLNEEYTNFSDQNLDNNLSNKNNINNTQKFILLQNKKFKKNKILIIFLLYYLLNIK
ncbi:hypothetical protein [Caminicella sporogenes]|uniref:hypothetical protein n=1 Tax=Caminicella sporogenes TaxID=166485 RepID=UPI0025423778|nr:hypothetical protein [Caminicella sporogenes]WIF94391.1 hypothetical protein QNI18_08960 [Caminicella sporogenes]